MRAPGGPDEDRAGRFGAEWEGAPVLIGDLADAVRALKAQPGRELQVHGSGRLVQSLAQHDRLDVYRLSSTPWCSGPVTRTDVAMQTYERAGAVETGSSEP